KLCTRCIYSLVQFSFHAANHRDSVAKRLVLHSGGPMGIRHPLSLIAFAACLILPSVASAGEFYVGEPIVQDNMQIVPNYLTGIKMQPMPKGMDMGWDATPIEPDSHQTKDEKHGFAEDA